MDCVSDSEGKISKRWVKYYNYKFNVWNKTTRWNHLKYLNVTKKNCTLVSLLELEPCEKKRKKRNFESFWGKMPSQWSYIKLLCYLCIDGSQQNMVVCCQGEIQRRERRVEYLCGSGIMTIPTQSLYSLVNHKHAINDSHIFCAVTLKNDIHFNPNNNHAANEAKGSKRNKAAC